VVGNKLYGGKRDFHSVEIEFRWRYAIIFAQALMFIPPLLAGIWRDSDIGAYVGTTFCRLHIMAVQLVVCFIDFDLYVLLYGDYRSFE